MHKRWLKNTTNENELHHPKYLAKNESDSAATQRTLANISLPFRCLPEAKIWPLGWTDEEALVVNFDLKMAGAKPAVLPQLDSFSKD